MIKVGDKVVCIDNTMQEHTIRELKIDVPNWIEKDKIYTVRQINDFGFVVSILVEELKNPLKYFKVINKVLEPSFAIIRFRKITEEEVEIEEHEFQTHELN